MAKQKDDIWTNAGYYMITVYFGAEKFSKYIVSADSYGEAIKKIVCEYIDEYPEGFDFDSEIKFVREIFDEIK